MSNQIMLLKPYKWEGMWVFDDERVGLHKEPFVAGADTLIDFAVVEKAIKDADRGFIVVFSADPFPGADLELQWSRQEMGGNVYCWNDREAWLCGALLKYFPTAPSKIYLQFKPAQHAAR